VGAAKRFGFAGTHPKRLVFQSSMDKPTPVLAGVAIALAALQLLVHGLPDTELEYGPLVLVGLWFALPPLLAGVCLGTSRVVGATATSMAARITAHRRAQQEDAAVSIDRGALAVVEAADGRLSEPSTSAAER
jgi:hypothetical protein